jgi:hypothetical protein
MCYLSFEHPNNITDTCATPLHETFITTIIILQQQHQHQHPQLLPLWDGTLHKWQAEKNHTCQASTSILL